MLHSIFLKPLPFDFNSPSQQNKKIFFILHSINSEPNETDIQRIKTLANELIRKFKRKSDYLQLRQKRRKHVQSVKSLSKNIEVFFISKGACCKISVRIRQSWAVCLVCKECIMKKGDFLMLKSANLAIEELILNLVDLSSFLICI